jgi:hypothetical protein
MNPDEVSKQAAVDEQKVIGRDIPDAPTRTSTDQSRAVGEFSGAKHGTKLTMKVHVYSPARNYYDSTAFSISAQSATGPFDILPHHHNFISLLSACDLIIRPAIGGEQKIVISGGIMHVKADQVIVFLDV